MTQNRTPQPSPEAIGEPVDVVALPDDRIPAVPADVANSNAPPVPAAPALAPKVVPGLLEPQLVPIGDLVPDAGNARRHPEKNLRAIRDSLSQFGQRKPLVVQRQEDGTLIVRAGNGTLEAARQLGWATVAVTIVDEDNATAAGFAIADNRTGELAEWDDEALAAMLDGIDEGSRALLGFDADDMADLSARLVEGLAEGAQSKAAESRGKLAERFLIPPFSVLNAREGWWQDRKRAWISLGIKSELGRSAASASPSGSPRPACDYSNNELGDGNGRPMKKVDPTSFGNAAQWQQKAKAPHAIPGGGNDPQYYAKKQAVEAALGRELTTEEFQRDFYAGPESYASGTSIFDPVLVEIALRWFAPPAGVVLDPFAGGSVRGIVSGLLGHPYVGCELRAEQVEANRVQAAQILAGQPTETPDFTPELTPIEMHGGHRVKRDDLFSIAGVRGGKVRSCWTLAQGAQGLVTAGSRASPQVNIVAHIARRLGIPCRVHVPTGELSPEVQAAKDCGAEVVQHAAVYNTVIVARAREDAAATGWREIPFGMECAEAVEATRKQVANLPDDVTRIVMPVGSGMSLAGVLWGLEDRGLHIPVLGVQVGADPSDRLDEYAPKDWRQRVELVPSGLDYHQPASSCLLDDLELDPIYEAKCLPFLDEGDLLWCVGIRQTASAPSLDFVDRSKAQAPVWHCGDSRATIPTLGVQADIVFSCPPYYDLEVYSEDPNDLSNMPWPQFVDAYRAIIRAAVDKLRPDSFAVFVVGEVRDQKGLYRDFVGETVQAFVDAGAAYYNEAILVTAIGSLPVRAGRTFALTRKLGKTHQNVLVFCKGDPRRAAERCKLIKVDEAIDQNATLAEGAE